MTATVLEQQPCGLVKQGFATVRVHSLPLRQIQLPHPTR